MQDVIELAGRKYGLRYTINSMCAMEDMAGGSLDGIFNRQFSAVRLILWGGMIDELPELTLNDVGAILDRHIATGASLDDIIELCHRALENSGFIEND